jgi:hypothetical protein
MSGPPSGEGRKRQTKKEGREEGREEGKERRRKVGRKKIKFLPSLIVVVKSGLHLWVVVGGARYCKQEGRQASRNIEEEEDRNKE